MAASSKARSGSFKGLNSPSGSVFSGAGSRYSSGAAFPSSPSSTVNLIQHHSHRPPSPTRVNLLASRILDPISSKRGPISAAPPRKKCMCSPTTHPGSFRCSLHKGHGSAHGRVGGVGRHCSASLPSNRLNARRSAMTNSLVRIGTVKGELVKRPLAALIRPSSHQQRRRAEFQARPSRLSVMSKAFDI